MWEKMRERCGQMRELCGQMRELCGQMRELHEPMTVVYMNFAQMLGMQECNSAMT